VEGWAPGEGGATVFHQLPMFESIAEETPPAASSASAASASAAPPGAASSASAAFASEAPFVYDPSEHGQSTTHNDTTSHQRSHGDGHLKSNSNVAAFPN
jgi:hypothetical protein